MVDYYAVSFEQLYPDEAVPDEFTPGTRENALSTNERLQQDAQAVLDVITNPEVAQLLRQDNFGNYSAAADYLYHFRVLYRVRVLSTDPDFTMSTTSPPPPSSRANREPDSSPCMCGTHFGSELEMGTQLPELDIKHIGKLTMAQFRSIFCLTYSGDPDIVLRTNPRYNVSTSRRSAPLRASLPRVHPSSLDAPAPSERVRSPAPAPSSRTGRAPPFCALASVRQARSLSVLPSTDGAVMRLSRTLCNCTTPH
ncbi:uncharacterized protein C8Q71DRAFT_437218 [Rhodofomes roseus]|uniref:Uncharacterized protein n=1 Tax=Rhodofomes roseus TaxID=34475 RepID=A0ABQ8KRA5_9APHY|nr:uncharacterized protein C8Q71DRAFT_437218 [Rhodofomes roseus]KAH9841065.1 hypothetical protein C8Q71DRAFT_437218 [Rhodofomes roseus]